MWEEFNVSSSHIPDAIVIIHLIVRLPLLQMGVVPQYSAPVTIVSYESIAESSFPIGHLSAR